MSFKQYIEENNLLNSIIKPNKKNHTQALNRNTIDRDHLNFVPRSDNVKRSHYIIKKFEKNKNLKFLPIPSEKIASELANIFGLTITDDKKNFNMSLKRTGLNLVRYNNKYSVIRKK
jgi:hypothetical protein